jgi:hypothetical protein
VRDTVRGVTIFVAVLLTIGIWAPLRNKPERLPSGVIVTETYFGVLRYLTLRTELKEPEYRMYWIPDYGKAGATAAITGLLWVGVVMLTRKRKAAEAGSSD